MDDGGGGVGWFQVVVPGCRWKLAWAGEQRPVNSRHENPGKKEHAALASRVAASATTTTLESPVTTTSSSSPPHFRHSQRCQRQDLNGSSQQQAMRPSITLHQRWRVLCKEEEEEEEEEKKEHGSSRTLNLNPPRAVGAQQRDGSKGCKCSRPIVVSWTRGAGEPKRGRGLHRELRRRGGRAAAMQRRGVASHVPSVLGGDEKGDWQVQLKCISSADATNHFGAKPETAKLVEGNVVDRSPADNSPCVCGRLHPTILFIFPPALVARGWLELGWVSLGQEFTPQPAHIAWMMGNREKKNRTAGIASPPTAQRPGLSRGRVWHVKAHRRCPVRPSGSAGGGQAVAPSRARYAPVPGRRDVLRACHAG